MFFVTKGMIFSPKFITRCLAVELCPNSLGAHSALTDALAEFRGELPKGRKRGERKGGQAG